MNKAVNDIIKDVRICIDEQGLNDADFIGGTDDAEMDTLIRSKILEAVRYVHGNADWAFLNPEVVWSYLPQDDESGDESGDVTMKIENNVGIVELPDNFLRLCYAKFDSWPIYMTDIIYWNDPEYATLFDDVATGTPERPKLAQDFDGTKKTLKLFKGGQNDKFSVGVLLEPTISGDTGPTVFICDKLEDAVTYYTAGLVLLTYNEQRADNLFNIALTHMGINTNAQ